MNKLFRTFFIFLLLLSTRTGFAATHEFQNQVKEKSDNYAARQSLPKNLTGLNSISSLQHHTPRQTSSDLETLYSQAQPAQNELNILIEQIIKNTVLTASLPQIKTFERAHNKVTTKFNGDASQITDLARASIVAHNIHDLMQAYQTLSEQTEVIQVKNRFASPKESGYRDLNALIKLPQTGMIVEVQLHLNEIAKIKSGSEHQNYQEVQGIEALASSENRNLLDAETARIVQLRQSSHKQYHKAWLNYKRIDNAGVLQAAA
ncbi:RelA/SpoT domain-containing protein [Shewanella sp. D64]|uniref:RelA/SpoT domain-containing protein n=1 Tax=unclassified Shewanella TaxID=196818 RepID=UPI0022BA6C5C|nr:MULTISPECIES: RelA/SpoT domain-containing protein [unclassified Shewanella]MEC4728182.1 RelA/SpoT domain-containing protein [Shewanella sp. D64]MEC4739979.1 RelA/SpoT domain-containing protein [Shewanella sp. E94]WBJ94338.1 RelA/SpoT domain-containing protein [Shewanella sp. MTB7]